MNGMSDFRFSWIQPTKLRRRSFLAAFAGLGAVFAVTRRSNAGEMSHVDREATDQSGEGLKKKVPMTIDLKTLGPERLVASIASSASGYRVTMASGKTISFTEFDLRFKTDSSAHGPTEGHPVLLPASMRTDRAFVVFASLREINAFVDRPA
jgi:cytochrome c